uniref:Uncharacterized protein n=1 Tax=Syphacia muris TaxID=451379 RepID=A0A0N5AZA5_9BILA
MELDTRFAYIKNVHCDCAERAAASASASAAAAAALSNSKWTTNKWMTVRAFGSGECNRAHRLQQSSMFRYIVT